MLRRSVLHASAPNTAAASASTPSLLGYPVRRSAASEMLYGGVRLRHLAGQPFALHKIRSETMPSPSLARERHDLGLEMQLPADVPGGYGNVNMAIQRQVAPGMETEVSGGDEAGAPRWNMGDFFGQLHHPERHHNSSLPYSTGDTNNVMGLRLFPLNMHARLRTDGVRIRTQDCLERLRDGQLCQDVGMPVEYPLPLAKRYAYAQLRDAKKRTGSASRADANVTHLRGAGYHPAPKDLSIFTRPIDRMEAHSRGTTGTDTHVALSNAGSPLPFYVKSSAAARPARGSASASSSSSTMTVSAWAWKPLQMMKPITHNWSASMRSSGVRGPHMQLLQERIDQKGFGWKRKSRSLWQQDIATAGFRPHRYF